MRIVCKILLKDRFSYTVVYVTDSLFSMRECIFLYIHTVLYVNASIINGWCVCCDFRMHQCLMSWFLCWSHVTKDQESRILYKLKKEKDMMKHEIILDKPRDKDLFLHLCFPSSGTQITFPFRNKEVQPYSQLIVSRICKLLSLFKPKLLVTFIAFIHFIKKI